MCEPLCETDWKLVLAFLSVITTLIVSVFSLYITNRNSQKNRLVDVITSNRVQWIQKSKELMAAYLSKVSYHYAREFPDKSESFMDDLLEISAQIKLHLNYRGKLDKYIIDSLDELNIAYEKFFIYVKFFKKY